jgi:hypothetical protein
MNGGHRAVGQFEHGLKRRGGLYTCASSTRFPVDSGAQPIAILPGRGVSSRRILLPLHSSSATSTAVFQIVLGGTAALHVHRAWGAVLFWG